MANNYLLIDFGNTYVKGALYDVKKHKIVKTTQVKKTTYAKELLTKLKTLKNKPLKIFESVTSMSSYVKPFNKDLCRICQAPITILSKKDFEDVLDFSNISSDVVIGVDILLTTYYLSCLKKDSAAMSFGTAYYCVIQKNKQLSNCYLLPNMTRALEDISRSTTIPHDYIPTKYDKEKGNNTINAFSAGANLVIDGFIDKVIEDNNIKPSNFFLTGGDSCKFGNINKKYKEIKTLVLQAIALLIKQKKW